MLAVLQALGKVFCLDVAVGLEYGMVCINDGILSTEVTPFGGGSYRKTIESSAA